MDNASFHKNGALIKLIKFRGHVVEFLPPYLPNLNSIEDKWAEKKAFRRKYCRVVEACYA